MKVSLEDFLYEGLLSDEALSLESLAQETAADKYIYILLTDTGTTFSKISKAITGDPYNHVSMMLNYDFDNIYTFALKNGLNKSGGFMREDRKDLLGSRYSLYKMAVTKEAFDKIENRIKDYIQNVQQTSYNHFGLINAVLQKGIFKDSDGELIYSQFVAGVLKEAGITLFKDTPLSAIRPYQFVKSRLLKWVERGTIK